MKAAFKLLEGGNRSDLLRRGAAPLILYCYRDLVVLLAPITSQLIIFSVAVIIAR